MLTRNRYFTGQVLTAKDFQDEQSYFRQQMCLHNRYLHGYGIVSDLKTSVSKGQVTVSPGVALDCAGNLLFVEEALQARLPGDHLSCYICLLLVEQETGFVPVIGEEMTESEQLQATRMIERVELAWRIDDPCLNCGPGGSPGCGRQHPLPLARILRTRRGGRVDQRYHPPTCRCKHTE